MSVQTPARRPRVEKLLFSPQEAAERLGISYPTVWRIGHEHAVFRGRSLIGCRGTRYHAAQIDLCARALVGAITPEEADIEWEAWLARGGDATRRLGPPVRRRK